MGDHRGGVDEGFGSRHGFEQEGLQDRHMDERLRNGLWDVLYRHWPYGSAVREAMWGWAGMTLDELEAQGVHDMYEQVERMDSLEPAEMACFSALENDGVLARLKKEYFDLPKDRHYRIYELVELVCGGLEGEKLEAFAADINAALAKNHSAYTLSGGRLERAMSKLEHGAVEEASQMSPTINRHVKKAQAYMGPTGQDHEASISESVKAVENAAQAMGGKGGGLTQLVNSLSARLGLHPVMREQFAQMYKFANKTSRHSELGKKYTPDSHDAKVMLVWCSAMANYLVDKAAAGGSPRPDPQPREGEANVPTGGDPHDPKGATGHTIKGHALLSRGRYADALGAFEEAIEADPRSADAYHGRGRALFMIEKRGDALKAYDRAIDLAGNHFMAHLDKGVALDRLGQHKAAIAAFEKACIINPKNAEVHLRKSRALHEIERHEEALTPCRRAIELDPDNPDVHSTKADILGKLGHHEDALESIDRAILLDRNDAKLHVKRGNVLDRLGRIPEAMSAHHLATKMDPAMSRLVPQD